MDKEERKRQADNFKVQGSEIPNSDLVDRYIKAKGITREELSMQVSEAQSYLEGYSVEDAYREAIGKANNSLVHVPSNNKSS